MKTVLGIEVGIVAAMMLVLCVTAPGPEQPDGADGPAMETTVENGELINRPAPTPRAIVTPYVLASGAFLAVVAPLLIRARRGHGDSK